MEEVRELKDVVELNEKAKELQDEVDKLKDEFKALKDKIQQEFLRELEGFTSARLSEENEPREEQSSYNEEDIR